MLNGVILVLLIALAGVVVRSHLPAHANFSGGRSGDADSLRAATSDSVAVTQQAAAQDAPMSAAELRAALNTAHDVIVLDVRTREEFAKGHIPSAVNIPHDEVYSRALDELPQSKMIVVSTFDCGGENDPGKIISEDLKLMGFSRSRLLEKGIAGWQQAGFEIHSGDRAEP